MIIDETKTAVEVRIEIGAEILKAMEKDEVFPLSDVYKVASNIVSYFQDETSNYIPALEELNYTWRMKTSYAVSHLKKFREFLRQKDGKFFEFNRKTGEFLGTWGFVKKAEFEAITGREYAGINTRAGHYNEKVNDGSQRWKLNHTPAIQLTPIYLPGELFSGDVNNV